MANLFTDIGPSPDIDNLVAGNLFPTQTTIVRLAAGASFKRGDVLASNAAGDGTYARATTAAITNLQRFAILLDDADATGGEVTAAAALTGEFNLLAVNLPTTADTNEYVTTLSKQGLFLKENMVAPAPPTI